MLKLIYKLIYNLMPQICEQECLMLADGELQYNTR